MRFEACMVISSIFLTLPRSYEAKISEQTSIGVHSFDDIHDQTISFSRSKDWETDSILSDISDIDDSLRTSRYSQDRNRQSATTVFVGHSSPSEKAILFECESPRHLVQPDQLSSNRSDVSRTTDPQHIVGGSGDGADASDYFWLEEVADLASV
jgi:hypothetical protein